MLVCLRYVAPMLGGGHCCFFLFFLATLDFTQFFVFLTLYHFVFCIHLHGIYTMIAWVVKFATRKLIRVCVRSGQNCVETMKN